MAISNNPDFQAGGKARMAIISAGSHIREAHRDLNGLYHLAAESSETAHITEFGEAYKLIEVAQQLIERGRAKLIQAVEPSADERMIGFHAGMVHAAELLYEESMKRIKSGQSQGDFNLASLFLKLSEDERQGTGAYRQDKK